MTSGAKAAAVLGALVVGVAGAAVAVNVSDNNNQQAVTTTPTSTLTCPSHPCETDTLGIKDSSFAIPTRAKAEIDSAKLELCRTTITGKSFAASGGRGHFYDARAHLQLAETVSPLVLKSAYQFMWDNQVVKTTISGTKYCANPTKYQGGFWEQTFTALNGQKNNLNGYSDESPTITNLSGG